MARKKKVAEPDFTVVSGHTCTLVERQGIAFVAELISTMRANGVSKFKMDGTEFDLYPDFDSAKNIEGHTEEQKKQRIRDALKDAATMAGDDESELFWST